MPPPTSAGARAVDSGVDVARQYVATEGWTRRLGESHEACFDDYRAQRHAYRLCKIPSTTLAKSTQSCAVNVSIT